MVYLPLGKLNLELLEKLLNKYQSLQDPRLAVGPEIGEDAVVIDFGDRYLVAKTDPITFATDEIGWYAVHVNANDIATRGAKPKWFQSTILLPEGKTTEELIDRKFNQILVSGAAMLAFGLGGCGSESKSLVADAHEASPDTSGETADLHPPQETRPRDTDTDSYHDLSTPDQEDSWQETQDIETNDSSLDLPEMDNFFPRDYVISSLGEVSWQIQEPTNEILFLIEFDKFEVVEPAPQEPIETSNTKVEDAPSGFRAISRDAAMKLNVFNGYTYTLETIIQAGNKNMAITSVPIRVNEYLRPSRLIKSIPSYLKRSFLTIFRIFVVYKPFRFFMTLGLILFVLGLLPGIRFLIYFFIEGGKGHIQSLILSAIFEIKIIYLYSPLGFFFHILDKPYTDILFLTSIWVINALLCIIPILLVKKRYSYILTLRQKM